DVERVRGLRGGADDYLGKPFSPAELTARIEAVLRRAAGQPQVRDVYDDGVVRVDVENATVTVRGEEVPLTPLEFRLLGAFTANAGQLLSSDQLLELAWGHEDVDGRERVKLYVGYLRKKIERNPSKPELIENVRGYGYRYRRPS